MSHHSPGAPGAPDDERRRRAEQETTQQPVIGPDGRPVQQEQQPHQQQSPQQQRQQPYAGPPAPPQSLGQGFGQGSGQGFGQGAGQQGGYQPPLQPQQPQYGPGSGPEAPPPQHQQQFGQPGQYGQTGQYGQAGQFGQPGQPGQQAQPGQPAQQPGAQQPQQPYFPPGAQPCFPLAPTTLSQPARLLGWIPVAIAILAFIGCFGTWATAKVSGSYLGTNLSISSSVNAFDHQSCKGTGAGAGACDEQGSGSDSSGSSGDASPSATGNDGDSLWEGWVVSLVALLVAGLGVIRGLGRRVAALPAAITAAVGGLVIIGLAVYRLIWIGNKSGDFADAMKTSGMPTGFETSLTSGWGLWLVLVMGVAMLAAGVGGTVKRR
ncbi:hypothetical protein HJ588_02845 [Flexivirga sp. ID2601S]|uniref:Uncharacterized protein n=1 Tax=Flexivirga aerilata TaxID=1656889 RepID=A0A849AG28_9MICO|nr:hypothetical protein [Flexivirga aerilata]NNG38211.1 hypothetical protein [Flexivirga aerilata]